MQDVDAMKSKRDALRGTVMNNIARTMTRNELLRAARKYQRTLSDREEVPVVDLERTAIKPRVVCEMAWSLVP